MSYLALYRKFRPQTFDEVRGQDAIVETLKNQIRSGRIGHAYLFCGTRGTGKTSVAKIFAKAVNCENAPDGNPCGTCASCRSILNGSTMNVVEIDAASNNGVDNIRELKEQVAYPPTEGRYKVFIIDEVHMLSTGAFNALLKTLEEPPEYVIFILATTEVHKIPITILSRCQRYNFRRITSEVIGRQLSNLAEAEGIEAEEKALSYIAKAADGSMRDALSLMDQCIAFYFGQPLTYENVLKVLGAVDTGVFHDLLTAVQQQNTSSALRILDRVVVEGRDLGQFVTEWIDFLRSLMIVKSGADVDELLEMSQENIDRLAEEAEGIDAPTIVRYIRIFSDLSNQIKYASSKRILIEVALIKLCKPQMEQNIEALTDRIAQLEAKLEKLEKEGVAVSVQPQQVIQQEPRQARPKPQPPAALPEDIQEIVRSWRSIIRELNEPLRSYAGAAKLSMDENNRLQMIFANPMAYEYMVEDRGEGTKKSVLEQEIAAKTNKTVHIKMDLLRGNENFEEKYFNLEDIIHTDIVIEEDAIPEDPS